MTFRFLALLFGLTLAAPALAERDQRPSERESAESTTMTAERPSGTRVVRDCGTRACDGFASDGGLGGTRIRDNDD